MSTPDSVTTWIHKLKEGNEDAAQQLWERYFQRLVKLARSRLGNTPKRVSDEEDVALSAFHSFCQAAGQDRFPQLDNRDDLWQILVMHTARKVVNQQRYQSRQKRGGSELHVNSEDELLNVIGNEPDPQFALEVAEQVELLLKCLKHEELRIIALRKLEGYTNEEIATELDYGESTIRRKMTLIRGSWEEAVKKSSEE